MVLTLTLIALLIEKTLIQMPNLKNKFSQHYDNGKTSSNNLSCPFIPIPLIGLTPCT